MAKDLLNLKVNVDMKQAKDDVQSLAKMLQQATEAQNRFNSSVKRSGGHSGNGNAATVVLDTAGMNRQLADSLKGVLGDLLSQQKELRSTSYSTGTRRGLRKNAAATSALNDNRELTNAITKVLQASDRSGLKDTENVIRRLMGSGHLTKNTYGSRKAEDVLESKNAFSSDRSDLKDLKSQVQKIASRTNNTESSIRKANGQGHITYERNAELSTRYNDDLGSADKLSAQLNTKIDMLSQRYDSSKVSRDSMGSRENLSSEDQALWDAKNKEMTQLGTLQGRYEDLQKTLKKTTDAMGENQRKLSDAVDSGSIDVDPKRDSFAAMMKSRAFGIGLNAVNSVTSSVAGAAQNGQSLRQQAAPTLNGIVMANAANGDISKRPDNQLLNRLATDGVRNGTNYNATSMAQFAGSFSQNSGITNTSTVRGAADAASKMSRFMGFGEDTTNSLVSILSQSGGLTNGKQLTSLSNGLEGIIQNSGMQGRANQQGSALNAVLSGMNSQGNTVTPGTAKGVAALQGTLAKADKSLGGDQGATMMSQMSTVASNGVNDPMFAAAWSGGQSKYTGARGMAQQQLDMTNPLAHPKELVGAVNRYLGMNGGDATITAAGLENLGMSSKKATQLANLAKEGKLTPEAVEKMKDSKGGAKTTKNLKKQYNATGGSTIDLKIAIDDRGNISMNEAGDPLRRGSNFVKKGMSGLGSGIGGAVMGFAGGAVQSAIGTFLGSKIPGIGKLFKGGKLSKTLGKFGTSKIGSKLTGLFKSKGGSLLGEADELAGTVAETGSLAATTTKSGGILSKVGSIGSKAIGAGKGLFSKVGGKALGKVGLKTAAKIGGKGLAKFVPFLGEGLMAVDAFNGVRDIAKDPGNAIKHPFKSIGSVLGLDKVNDDKGNGGKSGMKNNPNKTLDHADRWVHQFDITLTKAEKLIAMAKGIKLGTDGGSGGDSDSDGGGSSAGDVKLTGSESNKVKQLAKALKKADPKATDSGIAAILSNWKTESGFDTGAVNSKSGASGLGQWNLGRAKALKSYAKSQGKSWKDAGLQIDYALNKDSSKALFKKILEGTGSAKDLATQFSDHWEVGGHTADHVSHANAYKSLISKNALGGVFTSPQIGEFAEDGAEAIIPLSAKHRNQGRSLMQKASAMLGMSLDTNQNNYGGNNISYSPSHNVTIQGAGGDTSSLAKQIEQLWSRLNANDQRSFMARQSGFYGRQSKLS